jgi:hypothetical protein
MDAQTQITQVAVAVRLIRVDTFLVARRDEFDRRDELAVEVDIDSRLRVEANRDTRFQVRFEDSGIGVRLLGRLSRAPSPDTDIGLTANVCDRQGGDATEKRLVSLRQAGLNPLDEIRRAERVDAVPAPFVRPIALRHRLLPHAR